MIKHALISILAFVVVSAPAQSLLEPEDHFFGIPNLDSINNDWMLEISDSMDAGFGHPGDIDVLRLSPFDYRLSAARDR